MSRKVILYISQSLDGFIADSGGGVDWIMGNDDKYDGDYGYRDFIKNIDTVILGANTYKQIRRELSPNEWVYKDLQSYVLTKEKLENIPGVKYANMDIRKLIDGLQKENGKAIWICGGASLVNQCVKEDLIDEYQITTVPVILGGGMRLFEENHRKIRLKLTSMKEENGLITSVYVKK